MAGGFVLPLLLAQARAAGGRVPCFVHFPGSLTCQMSTKIYVGNLPWRTTDQQLNDLFSAHGDVLSVRIISDRDTGRSRGFAFVTMTTADGAQSAISALNGSLLEGRTLVVNEANNQGSRPGAGRAPVSVRTADPAPRDDDGH